MDQQTSLQEKIETETSVGQFQKELSPNTLTPQQGPAVESEGETSSDVGTPDEKPLLSSSIVLILVLIIPCKPFKGNTLLIMVEDGFCHLVAGSMSVL